MIQVGTALVTALLLFATAGKARTSIAGRESLTFRGFTESFLLGIRKHF